MSYLALTQAPPRVFRIQAGTIVVRKGVVMIVQPVTSRPRDLPQYCTWVVVDDLHELRGPRTGYLTLPNHLWWNSHSAFCLGNADEVYTAYRSILREAVAEKDLTGA